MDNKAKNFIITGVLTWSVILQGVPLAVAFTGVVDAKGDDMKILEKDSVCMPEPASSENGFIARLC